MGRAATAAPEDFLARVGQEEMGRIFHLRDSLEQSEALIQHALRYQELGWSLVASRGERVEDTSVDFTQPPEVWGERLMTLALAGAQLDLGVKTGRASGLLVLETPPPGTALDRYGEWRSPCQAQAEDGWEGHFYMLDSGFLQPISGEAPDIGVRVYGDIGQVQVPPSRRDGNGAAWSWSTPPWETPPSPPQPAVWRFLEDSGLLAATDPSDPTAKLLPWDQVYHFIAPHEKIIRTLLAPATSMDAYYRELATAALKSGLGDPDFLLALLWHAPHGDARTSPERLAHLETLIAEASRQHRMGQGNLSPATYKDSGDDPVRKARGRPAAAPASEPVTEIMDFMENRVILDRNRYEAMVFELGELSAKADVLERRVAEWEGRFGEVQVSRQVLSKAEPPAVTSREETGDSPALDPGTSIQNLPVKGLKAVFQQFLQDNADLAQDPNSVQMLQFCLENYIDLNPELHSLPLGEKLAMAGNMARDFLKRVCPGNA